MSIRNSKSTVSNRPQWLGGLLLLILATLSQLSWSMPPGQETLNETQRPSNALAKTLYVSDQLNIALRSGASTEHRIIRFLISGTPISVIDQLSEDESWVHVALLDQTQGWVNARYLMEQPSARVQLEQAKNKITSLETQISKSRHSSTQTKTQSVSLKQQLDELNNKHASLSKDHASLQQVCSNAKTMSRENQHLREAVTDQTLMVNELENINSILRHDQRNEGILHGAIAALIGAIIALLAPKLMRRSNRDVWG